MFRPDVKRPEIVVHYDPSQAMALPLVKGLLAEHVMKGVSRAAFDPETGKKLVEDLRGQRGASADLASLFDSIERLQARGAAAGSASKAAGQGVTMPFD